MRRFQRIEILAIAVIVLIGLVHLPHPFHDDQAFFTIGAWKMSHGAVLYRDYWDIKQPGIFFFYLAGGKLFGFNEIGIHGFELLYMVGLAFVLIVTLRDYFEQRWSSALAVLLTVGFYYGVTGLPHPTLDYLTQVEGLVGFPMFLCLWFASKAAERKEKRTAYLFISGIMGAFVLLLKLIFLPMLLCFWIAAFWYSEIRNRGSILGDVARFTIPVVLGLLAPILMVCAYFAGHGGLGPLWYSSFVWPMLAMGKLPLAGVGRLHNGLEFFVDGFAPLLGFGLLGAWWSLRKSRDLLTANLLIWVATGIATILVQRRSWWPHHYLLLFVPLGILGTKGIEVVWQQLQHTEGRALSSGQNAFFAVALAVLFSPVIYPVITDGLLLARYKLALTGEQRLNYQCRYPNNQYLTSSEIAFLSQPDSLPGSIYVGGSTLYYYLSGRSPAIPLCAGVDDFLPDQWTAFVKELADARPAYVFVSTADQEMFEANSSATVRFIQENYRVLQQGARGIWYVVKLAGASSRSKGELPFRTPSPGCPAQ